MKKFSTIIIMMLVTGIVYAQNQAFGYYQDVLVYSQTDVLRGSTARMQGLGGAQVALGGDLSSITSNPAGLGFFNRGVIAFTPSLDFVNTNSTYRIPFANYSDTPQESFNTNFNMANAGAVIHFPAARYGSGGWKGSSLGVSLSRNSSYHQSRSYEGINDYNSLADGIAFQAGTIDSDNLFNDYPLGDAAFNQYLISPEVDVDGNIQNYFADFDGFPIQNETIEERGSHYQLNVAWGGNYADLLYFGGGMGIQILNYRMERSYSETEFGFFDPNDDFVLDERLNAINLSDQTNVRGSGVNFNAGVVLRPLNFWTIGLSYTSPSFLALDEERFFDLEADWKQGAQFISDVDSVSLSGIDPYQSDLFVNSFSLRSPSRLSIGTSLFLGKYGFITGDIERVDYSGAIIRTNDFLENADNELINSIYQEVINLKLGAEVRFGNIRLRSGYAIYQSPYKGSNLEDQTAITYGVGYRNEDFFADLALVTRNRTNLYQPYDSFSDFQPIVESEINSTTASITVGFNF